MTKQEAELLAKKANERIIDLKRITSYPEYYALKEEIEKMIKRLDTNDSIEASESSDHMMVLATLIGNKKAKKELVTFLNSMGVYSEKKIVDSTYE